MSEWQRIIREESIATLEKLADKFGRDVIDVEALKPAFDNFQMRLTPRFARPTAASARAAGR